nr:MAG TPA: hypothetical protein [Caudoviricetes sp.]
MGNLHRTNSVRCGSSYPYFSHTILETLSWCVGLTQRENLFSLRGLIAKIQEKYLSKSRVREAHRDGREQRDCSETSIREIRKNSWRERRMR